MLDFVKAMKIAGRMCAMCENPSCEGCPIRIDAKVFYPFVAYEDWGKVDWDRVENRLIEWDKAHPEPQFPTWSEWQRENFPDAHFHMFPCTFCTPAKFGCNGSRGYECDSCRNQPIPADIAKKLGIQPINQQEKQPTDGGEKN